MKYRKVYLNGQIVNESDAVLSIHDTAISTGELIVEVTRTFNQKPYQLGKHLKRLQTGIRELDIDLNMSISDLTHLTNKLLKLNLPTEDKTVDWQIIHYVSRGLASSFQLFDTDLIQPSLVIVCIPLLKRVGKSAKKYTDGIDLVIPKQRAIPSQILSPQIKSRGRLDYLIARSQAKRIKPGSTAVLLDSNNHVIEGSGASLFFVFDKIIHTTPADKVVAGFTRELVLKLARRLNIPVRESLLTVNQAASAQEIFITSTVICLQHARTFNGDLINHGRIGNITTRIRQTYIKEVGVDFVAQAQLYSQMIANN